MNYITKTTMERKEYSEYRDGDLAYNHYLYEDLGMLDMGNQVHDVLELIYVKKGSFTYTVEGKSYRVKKNGLILTRPEKQHSLRFDVFRIYDRFDTLFDEKLLSSAVLERIPSGVDVMDFEGNPAVLEIFERMEFYCEKFEGEILRNLLIHLIEEVLCNVIISARRNDENTYTAHPLVVKAVEYIEENLSRDFHLEELCEELFISESYLYQLFMKHMGLSPKKYIVTKQLLWAQRRIRGGEKPTDVFGECGFVNYSTFYRAYRNRFGCAPSEEIAREVIREIKF